MLTLKPRTFGWRSWLKLTFRAAIYLVFTTFYIIFYNMYLHDLAWFAKNGINGNSWNFGQVFAITVWLPPVVGYIHLEMRELIFFSPLAAPHTSLSGVLGNQFSSGSLDSSTALANRMPYLCNHDEFDLLMFELFQEACTALSITVSCRPSESLEPGEWPR